MRALLGFLAVSVAGCNDLPDLGTCGNGIVEADTGEACDGDLVGGDTCSDTCELACQTSAVTDAYVVVPSSEADDRFCPDARMTCGLDGVCRGSSGQFIAVGAAQPFDTKFAIAGDFDGDGISDLIGTSATQIVVRLGAATAFTDGFAQAAPSSDSPIAIFDRAPDALALDNPDLALGVPTDGLALLTSDTEVFGPDLDLTFDVDDATQAHVVVRDPDPALEGSEVVLSIARMGTLAVRRIAIAGPHTQVALPTCGPANSRVLSVAIARDLTAFAIIGRPNVGPGFFICHYTPNATAFQMAQTNINAIPPDAAAFAQLDDDPCLDLAFTRIAPPVGVPSVLVAPATPGTCGFSTTLIALADFTDGDVLLAAGSIVPRAAGIERDELVLNSGVYRLEAGVFAPVIGPTSEINPWTTAAVVDLNGDGQLDVVAGRKGQDDVDVVRGGAIPNAYRADTTTAVVATVAGDFDGDFLGDVALIETSLQGQRVSILYGAHDGIVGEPVVTSRFGGVLQVARLGRAIWSGTSRGADGVDDLVVLRAIMGEPSRGGVLVGDAARIMTVPRIPPIMLTPGVKPPAIGAVAVGTFDGTVLAASLRPDLDTAAADSLISTNNIATGAWTDPIAISGFEVDTLRPLATVRTQAGVLVAAFSKPVIAGAGEMMQATIGLVGIDGTSCTKTLAGTQTSIRAADVDGDDGLDELIVTVDGGRFVHVFPVTTTASTCTIGDEILTDALGGCADVANAGDHLIALCETDSRARPGIFRITDGAREGSPAIKLDGLGLELVIGEFDGDGVRDIAVKLGRAAEVSVQFLKQCPAHDVRGCR